MSTWTGSGSFGEVFCPYDKSVQAYEFGNGFPETRETAASNRVMTSNWQAPPLFPELSADSVHVWIADLDSTESLLREFRATLSAGER